MGSSLYCWTLVAVTYQKTIGPWALEAKSLSKELGRRLRLASGVSRAEAYLRAIGCIITAWLTLSCKLTPESRELHEVTLMKMLYFYDPEACGQIHFYNFTYLVTEDLDQSPNLMIMPVKNPISAGFRNTMKIYVSLHVIWTALTVASLSQGQRDCGFYTVLLPFAFFGVIMLVTDLIFVAFFLVDAMRTQTEYDMLLYIESNLLGELQRPNATNLDLHPDTSWIALLGAFVCSRGIVQWFLNLWIIQDIYFDGLSIFRLGVADKIKERGDYK